MRWMQIRLLTGLRRNGWALLQVSCGPATKRRHRALPRVETSPRFAASISSKARVMVMAEYPRRAATSLGVSTLWPARSSAWIIKTCAEGLSVLNAATEIPEAAGRAVLKSVAALFITSAVVSLVTYL